MLEGTAKGFRNETRLMKRIDAIHLEYPFASACALRDRLGENASTSCRRHIGTSMAKMRIEAPYRKRDANHDHLQNRCTRTCCALKSERANHVRANDIT